MKKLLLILLLFVSLGAFAQTYDTLPTGSKPYGNFYLGPDGDLVFGNVGLKYRIVGTKKRIDSLLALKAPISGSLNYIQANPDTPQNANIFISRALTFPDFNGVYDGEYRNTFNGYNWVVRTTPGIVGGIRINGEAEYTAPYAHIFKISPSGTPSNVLTLWGGTQSGISFSRLTGSTNRMLAVNETGDLYTRDDNFLTTSSILPNQNRQTITRETEIQGPNFFITNTPETNLSESNFFLMQETSAGQIRRMNTNVFASASSLSGYVEKTGSTMTGDLILSSAIPTNALSAAPKSYIDNLITGLSWKSAVRVATTANIALSGTPTVDGVSLVSGNRVLVKNQTDQTQNGIYVVGTPWVRPTDADTPDEITNATVAVTTGTLNKNTQWTVTAAVNAIGTDNIIFGQISGAGTYAAGTNLGLSGNVFSVVPSPDFTTLGVSDNSTKAATTGFIQNRLALGQTIAAKSTGTTLQDVTTAGATTTSTLTSAGLNSSGNVISQGGGVVSSLSYNATVGLTGTASNHPFVIRTNAVEAARFLTSGNLGLGLSSPLGRLHVDQSGASSGYGQLITSDQHGLFAGTTSVSSSDILLRLTSGLSNRQGAAGGTPRLSMFADGVTNLNGRLVITNDVGNKLRLQKTIDAGQSNYIQFLDASGFQTGYVGHGGSSNLDMTLLSNIANLNLGSIGIIRMTIGTTANFTVPIMPKAGTTGTSAAPIKFTSGPLMTTPEAGALEFLTNRLYFTQSTGIRQSIAHLTDIPTVQTDLTASSTSVPSVNAVNAGLALKVNASSLSKYSNVDSANIFKTVQAVRAGDDSDPNVSYVDAGSIYTFSATGQAFMDGSGFLANGAANKQTNLIPTGLILSTAGTGYGAKITAPTVTGNRTVNVQDKDYTIAGLDDIANAASSGNFTPTLSTGNADITSLSVYNARYMRVGNTVEVSGMIGFTKIGTSSNDFVISMTIPVGGNFNSQYNAQGENHRDTTTSPVGYVFANSGANSVSLAFNLAATNANHKMIFKYTYDVK